MMVTILKLHECGQSLGQTLVIKEETKRRQNKVLVVEQPISSSPSWFIAASTVVLTLTLLLKKELPFYRSFFFTFQLLKGVYFYDIMTLQMLLYKIQLEYWSKDLSTLVLLSTEIL